MFDDNIIKSCKKVTDSSSVAVNEIQNQGVHNTSVKLFKAVLFMLYCQTLTINYLWSIL